MADAGTSLDIDTGSDTSNFIPVAGGRFAPGHDPRRNTAGRIKKKPTVLDETVALAHKAKNRRRIARAWVETMAETGTAPGNRARADFSDRVYGLPKQTLVLEQADSPLLAFLQRQAPALPYVDGESRDITTDSSAQT